MTREKSDNQKLSGVWLGGQGGRGGGNFLNAGMDGGVLCDCFCRLHREPREMNEVNNPVALKDIADECPDLEWRRMNVRIRKRIRFASTAGEGWLMRAPASWRT